jgi:hypothetical protein
MDLLSTIVILISRSCQPGCILESVCGIRFEILTETTSILSIVGGTHRYLIDIAGISPDFFQEFLHPK